MDKVTPVNKRHVEGGGYAISLSGIKKRYGRVIALDGVDLTIARGDIYGFLGPNGAGKSTTIKILAGLVRPDRGTVNLLGAARPASDHGPRQKVGLLIERPAFIPHLNAVDNLRCHWILQGRRGRDDSHAIMDCLARVGLNEAVRRPVKGFSTGMIQRLGLAQAFLGGPELIVLDEPLNGLDPEGILQIRRLIQEWAAERGTTFFISSHLLSEVEQLCTRVGFIARGRTVAEGGLDALAAGDRVKVRVCDPRKAEAAVLRQWPQSAPSREGEGTLTLRLEGDRIPDLIRLLVAENLDVYHAARQPKTLEEVFMEITRGGS